METIRACIDLLELKSTNQTLFISTSDQKEVISGLEDDNNNTSNLEKTYLHPIFVPEMFNIEDSNKETLKIALNSYFQKPALDQVNNELIMILKYNYNLYEKCEKLAHQLDLSPSVKANGFHSLLKVMNSVLQKLLKDLKKRVRSTRKLRNHLYYLRVVSFVFQITLICRDESIKKEAEKENSLMFSPTVSLYLMDVYLALIPHLTKYFSEKTMFYLKPNLAKKVKIMYRSLMYMHKFPLSLVTTLKEKKMRKTIKKTIENPSIQWPMAITDSPNNIFFRQMVTGVYHIKTECKSQTYFLPKQQRWLLKGFTNSPNDDSTFYPVDLKAEGPNDRKVLKSHKFGSKDGYVRIRVHRNPKGKPDGTVFFHAHGGGFVCFSPDAHEIYLQEWLHECPNMILISVAYKLRRPFPAAQQDILDAYMWLTSGSEQVYDVLGIQPTKIIVGGDSSGANLTFNLCVILTKMQQMEKQQMDLPPSPPIPHAFISIYGFFSMTTPSVSFCLSFLDTLLHPNMVRIIFGSLVYGANDPKLMKRLFCHCFSSKKYWYDTNINAYETTKYFLNVLRQNYYMNSMNLFDFEKLKIPAFFFTSEFDLCLDFSVEMARKWKGKVNLDVVEGLPHGFLQFNLLEDSIKKANLLLIDRIKKAFAS